MNSKDWKAARKYYKQNNLLPKKDLNNVLKYIFVAILVLQVLHTIFLVVIFSTSSNHSSGFSGSSSYRVANIGLSGMSIFWTLNIARNVFRGSSVNIWYVVVPTLITMGFIAISIPDEIDVYKNFMNYLDYMNLFGVKYKVDFKEHLHVYRLFYDIAFLSVFALLLLVYGGIYFYIKRQRTISY